jgi:Glycosyltransferase family 87
MLTVRIKRWGIALAAGWGIGLVATTALGAVARANTIDFHVFYEGALAWRFGGDLYATASASPNLNPPQFIVAFAPFTWLSLKPALVVWLIVNIAAAIAAGVVIWRALALPVSFFSVATGIAVGGLTSCFCFGLEEGQPTGLLALALTCAWVWARNDRWTKAAVVIGAIASVKPFFACLLLVPLIKGDWRSLTWAAVSGGAAVGGGIVLAGPHAFVRWLDTGRHVTWFAHPMNAAISGVAARAGFGLGVALLCSLVVLSVTAAAVGRTTNLDSSWLAFGAASVLVSPLGWIYYLPALAGPLTAVARRRWSIAVPGCVLVWPAPQLIAKTSITTLSALTMFSIPTWSLLMIWLLVTQYCWSGDSPVVSLARR